MTDTAKPPYDLPTEISERNAHCDCATELHQPTCRQSTWDSEVENYGSGTVTSRPYRAGGLNYDYGGYHGSPYGAGRSARAGAMVALFVVLACIIGGIVAGVVVFENRARDIE